MEKHAGGEKSLFRITQLKSSGEAEEKKNDEKTSTENSIGWGELTF